MKFDSKKHKLKCVKTFVRGSLSATKGDFIPDDVAAALPEDAIVNLLDVSKVCKLEENSGKTDESTDTDDTQDSSKTKKETAKK